ncbi:Uncharacterised protein [Mycobacterium tuberculosis]|uniref:Uncharacterized protein n=1 Tax=Mycobacterium tuberculosis TaxID=1773 RepID=A0A916P801_MYCTX|nr:Uncharacterised protein [Mycobacterium tuberculosis]
MAIRGRNSTSCSRCSKGTVKPTPVDSWIRIGHRSPMRSMARRAMFGSAVGLSFSSRRWMWATAAPAW